MRFGEIIKKAWRLTWNHRMLWVLGIFAGATGNSCSGSGVSSGSSGNSAATRGLPSNLSSDPSYYLDQARQALPFVLVVVGLLVLIGIASWVISIGARGGLVWAVNEIEEGRRPRLSEAWDAGFARFWSVFGLGLLLQFPLAIAWLLWVGVIVAAFFGATQGNGAGAGVMIAPACGALAIGFPLLLVASFVISIVYIIGLRFVMLQRLGTFDAAGEGWRAFRARIGDHVIMSLLTMVLNTVSGFVIAIPFVIVGIGFAIPGVLSLRSGHTASAVVIFGLMALFIIALAFFYAAVWSTFTSAIWTIFFRRLTGRERVISTMPPPSGAYPTPSGNPQSWAPPQAPAYPQPPAYPPPAYPPPAPPMAPQPGSDQPPLSDPGTPNG